MKYQSTKTYAPERGFSCAFRQWRADSHCRLIHGYALGVKFTFGANELDANGWVVDFGALKPVFAFLQETFDHRLVVAEDDPQIETLAALQNFGLAQLRVLPGVGCESFASFIKFKVDSWLRDEGFTPRVYLMSVEVFEHGANSATAFSLS
jgi:6-pyruvoyltetrahydropterin/6-carboxytetrahydropterin synthase